MNKKILSILVIGLLGLSTFSTFIPWIAEAQEITWNTNPTPLPTPAFSFSSIAHNGRVYVIAPYGGGGAISTNVYFADVNVDGTIGSWQETTHACMQL